MVSLSILLLLSFPLVRPFIFSLSFALSFTLFLLSLSLFLYPPLSHSHYTPLLGSLSLSLRHHSILPTRFDTLKVMQASNWETLIWKHYILIFFFPQVFSFVKRHQSCHQAVISIFYNFLKGYTFQWSKTTRGKNKRIEIECTFFCVEFYFCV